MAKTPHWKRSLHQSRAALFLLLFVSPFSGCQSPWRAWRKDPTMEELLVYPQPWDAETRLREDAQRRPSDGRPSDGRPSDGRPNEARLNGARANPYASRESASKPRSVQAAADDQHWASGKDAADDEEFSDADAEAALASAPAHLRPMLKRQWEAMRAQAALKSKPNASLPSSVADPVRDTPRTTSTAGSTTYRLSDATDELADEVAEPNAGQSNASRREQALNALTHDGKSRGRSEQRERTTRNRQEGDEESLIEADESATTVTSLAQVQRKQPRHLEELTPPAGNKTTRQIVHAEPFDTGMGDSAEVVPVAYTQRTPSAGDLNSAADKARLNNSQNNAQNNAQNNSLKNSQTYVATPAAELPHANATAADSAVGPSTSLTAGKKTNWRDSARETLRLLEEESQHATNASPAQQLHTQALQRFLHLTLGELEPALKPIEGLQPHEQEFFRHEMQSLYNAIDPNGNPVLSRRWALVMDSQRQAMTHLAAVSNLEIRNAAFCSNVDGFGATTKFPSLQFRANQELLLYCEVDNFVSDPVKDGFETKLQGSYEIVNANGVRVADVLLPQEVDVCRHLRRDYFFAYRIYMPQKIEPGRYQMRLTIEDMKGRKYGQSTLDFQIAAN